jgi:hypothetical protein
LLKIISKGRPTERSLDEKRIERYNLVLPPSTTEIRLDEKRIERIIPICNLIDY